MLLAACCAMRPSIIILATLWHMSSTLYLFKL
jgi:hypothetical protein